MPVRLIESLATTEPLAAIFSDESVLQAMLDFEVALARAEVRAGIVPQTAAEHIASVAHAGNFDVAALAHDMLRAGTVAIPVVKALREKVRPRNVDAAGWVHWGATSQDVSDTAIILLLKRCEPILLEDLKRLEQALVRLSEQHKDAIMLGRTLMQAAPPVTFGLKAAGWMGAAHRDGLRLRAAFSEALILQFGGASGTLASLGAHGVAVAHTLAEELGLHLPDAPWHAHRDRMANLLCCCGVLTGSLGKMARDISLMMQNEIAEVAEPGGKGRGGSSTMPHKQNPIACLLTLGAAERVPGLVATYLSGMVQEHERGLGNWQSEWPIISSIIQSTALAISSMAEVAEGLSVNPKRMRQNLENTNGLIFAERAMVVLATKAGRDTAQKLIDDAVRKSIAENKHLAAALADIPEAAAHLKSDLLQKLEVPEQYLGSAEVFRKALIDSSTAENPKREQ